MRWYDVEPDVYMAISMIECSESIKQVEYAKYIISKLKEKDLNMTYIKNAAKDNVDEHEFQRWYDRNELTSTAFKYLKNTSKDLQKEIALEVLAYMNTQNVFLY